MAEEILEVRRSGSRRGKDKSGSGGGGGSGGGSGGGYGGYQSLLLLERIIKKDQNVSYVIYGFIPHHEVRNVAAGSWLYLLNKYSKRGHASVPYSSINKSGNLIRHYPVDYLKLFLGDRLSVMAKIEKRIMKIKSRNREKKKFEISKKIIKEMKIITESNGAKFYMLILNEMPKPQLNNYKKFYLMGGSASWRNVRSLLKNNIHDIKILSICIFKI